MNLLFFLLLAFPSARAQEALDFHATLAKALDNSPAFKSQRLDQESSQLLEKNAWTSLLPMADLRATHAYTEFSGPQLATTNIPTHAPWSDQLGLTVTENLYDNGDTFRKARVASLDRKIADLNFEKGRSRLLVDVAKAFYDYSSAVGSLELQKQQIETLKGQLRSIEGRYRQGVSSNRDYLRIKAQVQTSEISLFTQEISVQNLATNLRVLLGDREAPAFLALKSDAIFNPVMNSKAIDVQSTFEFRAADLEDRASEIRSITAKRNLWPRLTLQGSYGYNVPQYIGPKNAGLDDRNWDLQAMIFLDFHLWDWGTAWRSSKVAVNTEQKEKFTQEISRVGTAQDSGSIPGPVAHGR